MSSAFAQCLAFTLRFEGGRVDDPRDPGGRTNAGITQRTYAAWLTQGRQPVRDVFAMTEAERDTIYRTAFWDRVAGDALGAGVDLAVFDYAVNSGPARALQAYAARTSIDGAEAVRTICARRLSALQALATFGTFGRGWTARVAACEALGVRMAEHARIGLPADAPTAPQVVGTLAAEARAARRHAVRTTRASGLVAVAGAVAHPAAIAASPLSWSAVAASALCCAAVTALLVWQAQQAKARATAYADAATI